MSPDPRRPQFPRRAKRTLLLAAALLLLAPTALAQNDRGRPPFEAASVKPVEPGRPGPGPLRGGPGTNSPGRLSGGASLKILLMQAYGLKNYQIAGPAWMDSERYEIAAKIPDGATKEQCALMLRSLLAERFHLAAHRETRKLPIYAMVAAKNGAKLKESSAADQNGSAGTADDSQTPPRAPKLTKGRDGFPDLAPGAEIAHSYEVVLGGPDGILYKLWKQCNS